MIPCKYWRKCGINKGGCCTIEAYHRPSFGVCLSHCKKYDGPPRGNIGKIYGADYTLPQAQPIRHAQILTGTSPSRPLLLGDRVNKIMTTVTRRGPCPGCKIVEKGLNILDQFGRKVVSHI